MRFSSFPRGFLYSLVADKAVSPVGLRGQREDVSTAQRMTPFALCLASVQRGCAYTAKDVHRKGHWLQMVRQYAVANTTQVVKRFFGDWPNAELISPTVRVDHALAVPEHPVPFSFGASPEPTGVSEIDLRPKCDDSVLWGKLAVHQEPQLSGVMQPDGDTSRLPLFYRIAGVES